MPSGLAAMVRVRRWWPVGSRLRVRKTSTGWQLVPERLSPGRWPTGWVSRRGSQLRAPRRRRDAEPWPATMTVASSSRLGRRLADTPLKSMRVPPRGSELPARPPAQQGNRANSLVAGMVWPSFVCAHELSATRITRPIATQTASVAAARSPIPRWAAEGASRPSASRPAEPAHARNGIGQRQRQRLGQLPRPRRLARHRPFGPPPVGSG